GLEGVWRPLAAAPVATAVVGPDGRFLKGNQALCALVGHPEGALLAAGYQAGVHPADRDADLEQLRRLLAGEATGYQLQQRCRRVDGEAISVSIGPPRPGRAPPGPPRCVRPPTPPPSGPSTAAAASTSCSVRRSGPS